MLKAKGSDLLVAALEQEGVDRIFGIPGEENLDVVESLRINDIGPYLPWAGLLRLGANLNDAPKSFEMIEQAEGYYRRVLAPFGQFGGCALAASDDA